MLVQGRPEQKAAIRSDSAGDGHFMAPRGGRLHAGVDIAAPAGLTVLLEHDATFIKVGQVYSATPKYRYIETLTDDIYTRHFYVKPAPELEGLIPRGATLHAGMRLGTVQDIAGHYPGQGMVNHVHLERYYRGEKELRGIEHYYDQKKDRTYISPV